MPWSSDFGDTLGGRDWVTLEMHLETVIERHWRYTRRPWWGAYKDALGQCDRAGLDEDLEVVDARCTGCWDSIHQLVKLQPWECDKETLPSIWALMESWLMAVDRVGRHAGRWSNIPWSTCNHENEGKTNKLGWMLYLVYVVLGVRCTRWMLYSVYYHDHGMERWRGMTWLCVLRWW